MINHSPCRLALPVALMCWAFVAGCGGPYDAGVSGVVTLDGQNLTRGTVSFNPVAGGPAAYARIDEGGNYSLRTGRDEGLPSGEYQATVIATEPPPVQATAQGGPPPSGKPITPMWYRSKDTSGLSFTVVPGSNEINLELTTQPPVGWSSRRLR